MGAPKPSLGHRRQLAAYADDDSELVGEEQVHCASRISTQVALSAVRHCWHHSGMIAELHDLGRAIGIVEVDDELPPEIMIEPQVRAGWGALVSESRTFELDRVEQRDGNVPHAIYLPA